MNRTDLFALGLLALGLTQIVGVTAGSSTVSGLAAATVASPAPKVFSVAKGLETFSTQFFLEWEDHQGTTESLPLTAEIYPRLEGPYKRRNVYGAVLAFGPVLFTEELTRPLFDDASSHALCGDAPVLRELGIDPDQVATNPRIRYVPRDDLDLREMPLMLEIDCS